MQKNLETEVIIAGGGLVGLTLALALNEYGIKSIVIDKITPETMLDDAYDGRASAIAFANMRMLEKLGVKEFLKFTPINEILVSDGKLKDGAMKGGSLGFSLHFDKDEISADEPLGFLVENRHMRFALDKVADKAANITRINPDEIISFTNNGGSISAVLKSGIELKGDLLVGADGRGSFVRRASGIKTNDFTYNQTGIVTTLEFENPHSNIAYEYFLPNGPFAILPLETNKACLVWSEPPKTANAILKLSNSEIEQLIMDRFGDSLGQIKIISKIFSYPLGMKLAQKWYLPRIALAGDACHGIHPVAGQGFNLGLKDVAALAECLRDAKTNGLDIGDSVTLENYAAWRRTDTMMVAMACDGFVRLFSNDFTPLRIARNIGIGLTDKISPVRKFFSKHAGGAVGDLPELLR